MRIVPSVSALFNLPQD